MAQFYLDMDAKAEIGYSSSPVSVNGTAGNADRILLRGNAANVSVGAAVEIVDFYGDSSAYSFVNEGGRVAVYRGDLLVATVASNDKTTELRFADGAITMAQDVETGALTVGGQEVTNEKAAYAGDELDAAHKSEAGGGSGPQPGPTPGKGQDYLLPADLGDGNIVTSGTGDDTYTTTTADGLKKDAQIVDGSATDNDVLTMSFSKTNENGSIVNVEKIVANWTGYADAEFSAKDISHVNGTEITVNTTRSVFDKATVSDLQNHHAVAGTGIRALTVTKAEDGAAVTLNDAATLTADGTGVLSVNAGKDFTLTIGTAGNYTGDDNVVSVNAAKDVTVTAGDEVVTTATPAGGSRDSITVANVAKDAASAGKVTLDLDTVNLSGASNPGDLDISNLKVDTVKLTLANGNSGSVFVADGQVIAFKDGGDGGQFKLRSDDADAAGSVNIILDADTAGALAITGDAGKGLTSMTITADTKVEIAELVGDEEVTLAGKEADADRFILAGKGDITVAALGAAVTVISGEEHTGKLIVTELDQGRAVAGKGGSEATTTTVSGDITYAGGEGKDAWTIDTSSGITLEADEKLIFDGGAGDDTVKIEGSSSKVLTLGGAKKGTLILDMGDGDDTVTIGGEANALTMAASGSLGIDFGAGAKDTLTVTNELTLGGTGEVGIRNMDILDVSAADADLTVAKQDIFGAWDFQVKGNGLTIQLDGSGDLDLSGLTSPDKAMSRVNISDGGESATVTLSSNLSENMILTANGDSSESFTSESKAVTLANFKANAEDKITFIDESGSGATVDVVKFKETDYTSGGKALTLNELLALAGEKADDGASGNKNTAACFEFDDITWLVYAATDGSDAATGDQILVKLAGVGYAESDLEASFTADDGTA